MMMEKKKKKPLPCKTCLILATCRERHRDLPRENFYIAVERCELITEYCKSVPDKFIGMLYSSRAIDTFYRFLTRKRIRIKYGF